MRAGSAPLSPPHRRLLASLAALALVGCQEETTPSAPPAQPTAPGSHQRGEDLEQKRAALTSALRQVAGPDPAELRCISRRIGSLPAREIRSTRDREAFYRLGGRATAPCFDAKR